MALIEYPTKLHEAAAKAETSTVASLINGDSIKEVDSLNQARCRDRPRTPRLPLALSRRLDAGVGVLPTPPAAPPQTPLIMCVRGRAENEAAAENIAACAKVSHCRRHRRLKPSAATPPPPPPPPPRRRRRPDRR